LEPKRVDRGCYIYLTAIWQGIGSITTSQPNLPLTIQITTPLLFFHHGFFSHIYPIHSQRRDIRFQSSDLTDCELFFRFLIMPHLPLFRDPWAKGAAWRKHPVFSNRVMFPSIFPGFGIAVVAFTAYVVVDNMFISANKSHQHH
jgi:NADH dehydrogenase (ubiquinone) 1 beta subcomplex subunit 3